MLGWFYTFMIHLYALSQIPRVLCDRRGRSLGSWLGRGVPVLSDAGPRFWVHAPSLGETRGVAVLIDRLRREFPSSQIVLSTTTATGQAEGRGIAGLDQVFYLPIDLPYIMRQVVGKIRPDCVILAESDLWYHFLREAKRWGAVVALVNGKVSARSAKRWKWVRPFARRLFGLLDRVCVQDHIYWERFQGLGVLPTCLEMTGNLKFDALPHRVTEEERMIWRHRLGLQTTDRIIVLGSTHDPEEGWCLSQLSDLLGVHREIKLLIVPRHPERFERVAHLIAQSGWGWGRYSKPDQITGRERIVLIDAMGVLNCCYGVCHVAIVGGSFIPEIGGHNVMEPLAQGVPVLFGPYMTSQHHMQVLIEAAGAGIQVELAALSGAVTHCLEDHQRYEELILAGSKLLSQVRGSLERTMRALPLNDIRSRARLTT